jgi:hypothetical protein
VAGSAKLKRVAVVHPDLNEKKINQINGFVNNGTLTQAEAHH